MRAVIGLGSNLGAREASLRAAVALLRRRVPLRRLRVSYFYETAPVGPPQPAFLNGAVLCETDLDAHALLIALQGIELDLGRVRAEPWGPRSIDLDLLWTDGDPIDDEQLVVPHPRLRERAFALTPLLELLPGLEPFQSTLDGLDEHLVPALPSSAEVRVETAGTIRAAATGLDLLDALSLALSAVAADGHENRDAHPWMRGPEDTILHSVVRSAALRGPIEANRGSSKEFEREIRAVVRGLIGEPVAGPVAITATPEGALTLRFVGAEGARARWIWALDHVVVRGQAPTRVDLLLRNCAD
jgi:2-amino-4-hydroxy-6-hydroxymethyldihydropteridine diphosphokinase